MPRRGRDPLPEYHEGSPSDRNTGRACWSCGGIMGRAPSALDRACTYPDSHGHGTHADALLPEKRCPNIGPEHTPHESETWWCSGKPDMPLARDTHLRESHRAEPVGGR
ncbi:hypothetical protein GCM10009795_096550 [Nocardioides hankookensis]